MSSESANETLYPKLRSVHAQPTVYRDQPALQLQDPLSVSDQTVIVPENLVPILYFCDGTNDLDMLRASLAKHSGLLLTPQQVAQVIQTLDDALLLDNERFAQAQQKALDDYYAAPYRQPALAGHSYPASATALHAYFDKLIAETTVNGTPVDQVRGVVSPHIDYRRGGPVYAQTWACAADAIAQAELAVVFGTDHNGGPGRITLTRQPYASPFGACPIDMAVVDAVVDAIGAEAAFAEELHHRQEHSIELAVTWLHYGLGQRQIPIVPILCGSFGAHVHRGSDPAADPVITATLHALRAATAGRRVLWVAAADLAHMGPAFGDPEPLDLPTRAHLQAADERLLQTIIDGDADAFFRCIQDEKDRWRVCGVAPIYLTLQMVQPARGQIVAYDHCPADAQNGSVVTIAGAVLG
jgi:AmmeMemoRadiSam system protein B